MKNVVEKSYQSIETTKHNLISVELFTAPHLSATDLDVKPNSEVFLEVMPNKKIPKGTIFTAKFSDWQIKHLKSESPLKTSSENPVFKVGNRIKIGTIKDNVNGNTTYKYTLTVKIGNTTWFKDPKITILTNNNPPK